MHTGTAFKNRDELLDIAKGIAIILVVAGHTLQSGENFDDKLAFRVIYSFHMPLFVFISGCVASLWFRPDAISLDWHENALKNSARLKSSATRLLLPFLCWTVFGYFVNHRDESAGAFALKVFQSPDWSLWFLVCIFNCTAIFVSLQMLLVGAHRALSKLKWKKLPASFLESGWVQLFLIYLLWRIIARRMPDYAGFPLANHFAIYFLLGMAFYKYGQPLFKGVWRFIPYVVFLMLVPLWSRTMNNQLDGSLPEFLGRTLFEKNYALIVAMSGTLIIFDLSKHLCRMRFVLVNRLLAFFATLSLGIYAIHYYFLGKSPPVFAPLVISSMLSFAILQVPILKTALLGERTMRKLPVATEE